MNPIKLAQKIEERYRRYLKATFYFKDPALRASFEEALNSGRLSQGPFLEATPVFKRGQTPRELFRSLLGFQPDEAFLKAVDGNRPLYRHQEEAIQAVFKGSNVIVATGTGSGKTEAFLNPILLHLYKEFWAGKLGPGVRALILYPMNALANDQPEHMRRLLRGSGLDISFALYTSDSDATTQQLREESVETERLTRADIGRDPPDIVLTNYKQLDFLLVRKADRHLFTRALRCLIFDELHSYRGALATEIACLVRRPKAQAGLRRASWWPSAPRPLWRAVMGASKPWHVLPEPSLARPCARKTSWLSHTQRGRSGPSPIALRFRTSMYRSLPCLTRPTMRKWWSWPSGCRKWLIPHKRRSTDMTALRPAISALSTTATNAGMSCSIKTWCATF